MAGVFQNGDATRPTETRVRVWDAATGKSLFFVKGLPVAGPVDIRAIVTVHGLSGSA